MAKAKPNPMIESISGVVDDVVLVAGKNGQYVRARPTYRRPTSDAQAVAADNMTTATQFYKTFTYEQAKAWRDYAKTQTRKNKLTGKSYTPAGYTVYVGYAAKFLQANPGGAIPSIPPVESKPFVNVTVQAVGTALGILFIASVPNSPGVVTEILLQTLVNERRTPQKTYTHAAFAPFAGEGLSFLLEREPGWYAVQVGAVRTATGQDGTTMNLGVVRVG